MDELAKTPPKPNNGIGPRLDKSAFEIANRIRARRIQLGLTGAEVANRVGQSAATYLAWERQFGPTSQSKHFPKLCEALSISEAILRGDEPHNFTPKPKPVENLSLSQHDLEALGCRAKERRKALRLTRADIALATNISHSSFFAWEKSIPSDISQEAIDVWESALAVPNGWLLDVTVEEEPVEGSPISESILGARPAKGMSLMQLDALGLRARDRRRELKLSRREITAQMGIVLSTINYWERSIPRAIRQESVEAWEVALKVPSGWLLDRSMEVPVPVPETVIVEIRESLTAVDEIRRVGCWIARRRGGRTMNVNQLTPSEARAADIFALRYGVAGEDASTLQAIGDVFGLTRERIRQIVEKMVERLFINKVKTPIIDKLFEDILTYLPASVADIDQHFREQLGEALSVESLDRFSREILGKGHVQITEKPGGMALPWEKVVINPLNHNENKVRAIRNASFEMIRSCGGAQMNWVAGTAAWQCGEFISAHDVQQACRMISGFNWLVEEDGWFWFGEDTPGDNRVLALSRKMLAVANRRLDVEDVQQGLARARRYNYDPNRPRPIMFETPSTVITAILSQMSWVKVIQSDDFIADPAIPVESVLSESELEMFNLMHQAGNVMARHELKKALSGNFTDIMMAINLDNSPIFAWLDIGVFALRGRKLGVAAIQRAIDGVGRSPVRPVDMVNGVVSFQITLSDYSVRNKFFEVPAGVACYIEDCDYQVDGFNTPAKGSSAYRRFYRLVQKLIQMGYEAGDTVIIQLIPDKKIIKIPAKKGKAESSPASQPVLTQVDCFLD